MKRGIHPNYYFDAICRCACGAVFHIPSTRKEMRIEICSRCHPVFTGKEKIIDKTGQVEKFKKREEKRRRLKRKKTKLNKVDRKTI